MSIVIDQSADQFEKAIKLNSRLEMINVVLKSATFSSVPDCGDNLQTESLSVGVNYATDDLRVTSLKLDADVKFDLSIFRAIPEEDDEIFIRIESTFTAKYSKEEDYTPDSEEVNAFHESNVVFNCWPYFREFAQSTVARMNFPPPPIPFLRINVFKADEQANQK